MKNSVDLIARFFLSFMFLYEAYDSIYYFQSTKLKMTEYYLTWRQDLLLVGSIIFLIMGGLMLLTGYRARFGALLLICYWAPVTFIVHSFWNDPPDADRRLQAILFMKNMSIIGGLLMVWVNGAGKYSIRRIFATSRVPRR